jgi:hypothetical protein
MCLMIQTSHPHKTHPDPTVEDNVRKEEQVAVKIIQPFLRFLDRLIKNHV